MPTRRTRIAAVIASGLLTAAATGTTAAAAQEQPHSTVIAPSQGGIAYLPTPLNLQSAAPNRWIDTSLQVTLPAAGTYDLDVNVEGRLVGPAPVNAVIVARLFDVNANTALANSERLVTQIQSNTAVAGQLRHNATAPISERIRVFGPTTIRLQAKRIVFSGTTTTADINSNSNGRTSFRYERV